MSYLSSKIVILYRQELVRRDVAHRTTDDNVESQGCSGVTHGQKTSWQSARPVDHTLTSKQHEKAEGGEEAHVVQEGEREWGKMHQADLAEGSNKSEVKG